ncbi:Uncharacterised protein [uncultured archaeon]|nr:Uncharacterised protein [uncultured archaeon]
MAKKLVYCGASDFFGRHNFCDLMRKLEAEKISESAYYSDSHETLVVYNSIEEDYIAIDTKVFLYGNYWRMRKIEKEILKIIKENKKRDAERFY